MARDTSSSMPVVEALDADDGHEGHGQDDGVEPGLGPGAQHVAEGQLGDDHGRLLRAGPGSSLATRPSTRVILRRRWRDDLVVVGGEEERRPQVAVDVVHGVQDVVGVLGVQVGRRLVGQDELGLLDHGPGDGHPLALAARELGRAGSVARSARSTQSRASRTALRRAAGGHAQQKQRELHVLVDRVDGQEVEGLEDEADVVVAQLGRLACGSASRSSRPGPRRCRVVGASSEPRMLSRVVLPEPLGPDQAGELARGESQVDVVEGGDRLPAHRIDLGQVRRFG